MRIILLVYIFVVDYFSVEVDLTSVEAKWPQYIFHPKFENALEGLKKRVQGEKDELWHVLGKIQKIEFLRELFSLKVQTLMDHLMDIQTTPYECPTENATYYSGNNMCYLLVRDKKIWHKARQDCLIRGGDLAQPLYSDDPLSQLLSHLIGNYDMPIYLGIISSASEGPTKLVYKFLTGLILPTVLYNPSTFPTPPMETTLTALLDRNTPSPSLYLTESSIEDLNAYICEFMAVLRSPKIDLKEILYKEYFVDYLPNENDVEMDISLVDCMSEDQFAIGTKCYKFLIACKLCQEAILTCKGDGGSLAKVDLSPKSRFGGVLADIIRNSNEETHPDIKFPIWIDGEDDGSERFLPDSSDISNSLCITLSQRSNPTPDAHCTVLFVPDPTPDILSDNNNWNVANTDDDIVLPFLCEYGALH